MKQRFLLNVLFLLNVVVNQNIEFGLNKNEIWQFKSNLSYHEKKRQTNKFIKGEKLNLIDLSENTGDFLYSDAVLLKDRSYVLALAVDKGLAIENIELEIVQKDQTSITINGKPLKVNVEEDIGYPTGGGTYIGTECEWLCVPFESLTETLFLYSIEFINPTLDDIQALMLYEGIELMQDSFYSDYEKISGPLISGSVGTYYANVDNPVTVEYLQSLLTAIDETDGDITDKIIIVKDTYSSNKNKIGEYEIVFSVSDSAGNTSTFTLIVYVQDKTAPIINGPDYLNYSYTNLVDIEEIKNNFSVTDNVDENVELLVESDHYTANANVPGTYEIVFSAIDSLGNKSAKKVEIRVIDDVEPIINGPDKIEKSLSSYVSIQEILANYTAEDDIDGILELNIIKDTYTDNNKKVGVYSITISATDYSNNTATKTIQVEVFDDIKPIWYIQGESNLLINVDYSLKLDEIDIKRVLSREKKIRLEDFELILIEDKDDYFVTEVPEIRKYKLTFLIQTLKMKEELNVILNVVEMKKTDQDLPTSKSEPSWFIKVFDFKHQSYGAIGVECLAILLLGYLIYVLNKRHEKQ